MNSEKVKFITKKKYIMYDKEFGIKRIIRFVGIFKNKHGMQLAPYYKFMDLQKNDTFNLYPRHFDDYIFTPIE